VNLKVNIKQKNELKEIYNQPILTTQAPQQLMTIEEKVFEENANTNPCSPISCNERGICIPSETSSFECICFRGFSGRFCELKNIISNVNQKKTEPFSTTMPTTTQTLFSMPPEFNTLEKSLVQVSNLVEQAHMRTTTAQMPFVSQKMEQSVQDGKKDIKISFQQPEVIKSIPKSFTSSDIFGFNKAIEGMFSPQPKQSIITSENQVPSSNPIQNVNNHPDHVLKPVKELINFGTSKIVESIQTKNGKSNGIASSNLIPINQNTGNIPSNLIPSTRIIQPNNIGMQGSVFKLDSPVSSQVIQPVKPFVPDAISIQSSETTQNSNDKYGSSQISQPIQQQTVTLPIQSNNYDWIESVVKPIQQNAGYVSNQVLHTINNIQPIATQSSNRHGSNQIFIDVPNKNTQNSFPSSLIQKSNFSQDFSKIYEYAQRAQFTNTIGSSFNPEAMVQSIKNVVLPVQTNNIGMKEFFQPSLSSSNNFEPEKKIQSFQPADNFGSFKQHTAQPIQFTQTQSSNNYGSNQNTFQPEQQQTDNFGSSQNVIQSVQPQSSNNYGSNQNIVKQSESYGSSKVAQPLNTLNFPSVMAQPSNNFGSSQTVIQSVQPQSNAYETNQVQVQQTENYGSNQVVEQPVQQVFTQSNSYGSNQNVVQPVPPVSQTNSFGSNQLVQPVRPILNQSNNQIFNSIPTIESIPIIGQKNYYDSYQKTQSKNNEQNLQLQSDNYRSSQDVETINTDKPVLTETNTFNSISQPVQQQIDSYGSRKVVQQINNAQPSNSFISNQNILQSTQQKTDNYGLGQSATHPVRPSFIQSIGSISQPFRQQTDSYGSSQESKPIVQSGGAQLSNSYGSSQTLIQSVQPSITQSNSSISQPVRRPINSAQSSVLPNQNIIQSAQQQTSSYGSTPEIVPPLLTQSFNTFGSNQNFIQSIQSKPNILDSNEYSGNSIQQVNSFSSNQAVKPINRIKTPIETHETSQIGRQNLESYVSSHIIQPIRNANSNLIQSDSYGSNKHIQLVKQQSDSYESNLAVEPLQTIQPEVTQSSSYGSNDKIAQSFQNQTNEPQKPTATYSNNFELNQIFHGQQPHAVSYGSRQNVEPFNAGLAQSNRFASIVQPVQQQTKIYGSNQIKPQPVKQVFTQSENYGSNKNVLQSIPTQTNSYDTNLMTQPINTIQLDVTQSTNSDDSYQNVLQPVEQQSIKVVQPVDHIQVKLETRLNNFHQAQTPTGAFGSSQYKTQPVKEVLSQFDNYPTNQNVVQPPVKFNNYDSSNNQKTGFFATSQVEAKRFQDKFNYESPKSVAQPIQIKISKSSNFHDDLDKFQPTQKQTNDHGSNQFILQPMNSISSIDTNSNYYEFNQDALKQVQQQTNNYGSNKEAQSIKSYFPNQNNMQPALNTVQTVVSQNNSYRTNTNDLQSVQQQSEMYGSSKVAQSLNTLNIQSGMAQPSINYGSYQNTFQPEQQQSDNYGSSQNVIQSVQPQSSNNYGSNQNIVIQSESYGSSKVAQPLNTLNIQSGMAQPSINYGSYQNTFQPEQQQSDNFGSSQTVIQSVQPQSNAYESNQVQVQQTENYGSNQVVEQPVQQVFTQSNSYGSNQNVVQPVPPNSQSNSFGSNQLVQPVRPILNQSNNQIFNSITTIESIPIIGQKNNYDSYQKTQSIKEPEKLQSSLPQPSNSYGSSQFITRPVKPSIIQQQTESYGSSKVIQPINTVHAGVAQPSNSFGSNQNIVQPKQQQPDSYGMSQTITQPLQPSITQSNSYKMNQNVLHPVQQQTDSYGSTQESKPINNVQSVVFQPSNNYGSNQNIVQSEQQLPDSYGSSQTVIHSVQPSITQSNSYESSSEIAQSVLTQSLNNFDSNQNFVNAVQQNNDNDNNNAVTFFSKPDIKKPSVAVSSNLESNRVFEPSEITKKNPISHIQSIISRFGSGLKNPPLVSANAQNNDRQINLVTPKNFLKLTEQLVKQNKDLESNQILQKLNSFDNSQHTNQQQIIENIQVDASTIFSSSTKTMEIISSTTINPLTSLASNNLMPTVVTKSPWRNFNFEKAVKSIVSNSINEPTVSNTDNIQNRIESNLLSESLQQKGNSNLDQTIISQPKTFVSKFFDSNLGKNFDSNVAGIFKN
jgi:hypothetical protein